jgi:hypothetical protein
MDPLARKQKVDDWAGRLWDKEREDSYITPNLQVVNQTQSSATKVKDGLLATKPICPEKRFVIIYGQGGAGKTFFLSRLAHLLSRAANASPVAPIPVLVQLRGILHSDALENWLSHSGFHMLSLRQITTLLRHGVVVPLLDALDEVVKGEERRGGDEFLKHLFGLAVNGSGGGGILACRDYYLTADRALVSDRAREYDFPELYIGPFDKKDTRKYIQVRTGLKPEHASRWANALEREAKEIVGEEAGFDVIRHPVVLATLARYILELPDEARANAADEFRLTRPDIFGEIVNELLKRERQKHTPQWEQKFAGQLDPGWMDPFDFQKQREVLRQITLLIAKKGGVRTQEGIHYMDFRHGLSCASGPVATQAARIECLKQVLSTLAGRPQVAATVQEEDAQRIEDAALSHLAEAYASHILAEPTLPENVVFALRHRFYFDYFLADALLQQIEAALAGRTTGETLVQWCIDHNTTGVFATCLDFLLWDPRVTRDGLAQLHATFSGKHSPNPVLASYLASLALAVFLRQRKLQDQVIERLQWGHVPDLDLCLMNDLVPEELSGFRIETCSFPCVTMDRVKLKNLQVIDCDFNTIRFTGNCRINKCSFQDVYCQNLCLEGDVVFTGSTLAIEGRLTVPSGAHVKVAHCTLASSIRKQLEQAREAGADVVLTDVTDLPELVPSAGQAAVSPGRRFINRLMALLRKEGRTEFAVYWFRLRDKTPGTDVQFAKAIELLETRGVVKTQGQMVTMTPSGAAHMYYHRLFGRPDYDSHDSFWQPIVEELDSILSV